MSSRTTNTDNLIRDAQQGISEAREELYRRYALRVLFMVRARMGPSLRLKEQSTDLAQEALLKSLSGLDRFLCRADGAFVGFLAKKVQEVICDRVDYWKAKCRNPMREAPFDAFASELEGLESNDSRAAHATSPAQILERIEDLERLARALDELKKDNRHYWELVLTVELESRDPADIADEQGVTVDAMRKKYARARAQLARIFRRIN